MGVSHITFYFSLGRKGCNRIHDDNINRSGADKAFGNFEGLFTVIGLADPHFVNIDTQVSGIGGIEGMLGIDKGGNTALLLTFRDGVEGKGRLSGRFGTVDFNDSAFRITSDSEGGIEKDRAGRNCLDVELKVLSAEFHKRTFSKLLFNLKTGRVQGLILFFPVFVGC